MRWIKTAENATDYSMMNTARQLLWLPTSREEKYKAKQAIDTFFVRGRRRAVAPASSTSARSVLHLDVAAVRCWEHRADARLARRGADRSCVRGTRPRGSRSGRSHRPQPRSRCCLIASPALAQETREEQLAAQRADKSLHLHPYRPDRARGSSSQG